MNKDKIEDLNYFLRKRKIERLEAENKTRKKRMFFLGILSGFLILTIFFLFSGEFRIYRVNIRGNQYLKDEDVKEIASLQDGGHSIFVIPYFAEKKLERSPFIKQAEVSVHQNIINITVEENLLVGYLYQDGQGCFLTADDIRIPADENNLYLIQSVPLIEGYDTERLIEIERGLKLLKPSTLRFISEIHRYPFSYDDNMLEIVMEDGNYLFASWTDLEMINNYYLILSGLDERNENICLYFDNVTHSAYSSACPWQKVEQKADDTDKDDQINEDDNEKEDQS